MTESSESPQPPSRRRLPPALRWAVIAMIAVPALFYGAHWTYQRVTHVHTLDARIEADMLTLSSRVSGWVTEVDWVAGDRVRRGDVLVALDAREAQLTLRALDGRYRALEAELDEVRARTAMVREQLGSRLAGAEARIEAWEAARDAAAVRQAQAERNFERVEPMARDNLVSEQALDVAAHALQEAREQGRRAEAELRNARAELDEARANMSEPAVLEQRARVLAARLEEVDAERERQRLEIEDRIIRSPIDGVIDKVYISNGEYVSPGQNLVMVHEPGAVWVEARVKETQLEPVQVGHPVRMRVDAFPNQRFTGRVERIVPAATSQFALLPNPNPSGNFTKVTQRIPVRIAFDEPNERLSPGMMVEVYIDVRSDDVR